MTTFPQTFPGAGQNAPATGASAVTKSDVADDPAGPFRGLNCNGSGTITVTLADGKVQSLYVTPGVNPYVVKRVWQTGTDGGITIVGLH